MNIDLNALVAVLMIFILTLFTVLLLHVGRHRKSNVYLSIYFISQIMGIAYFAFFPFGKNANVLLLAAGQSVVCMWGPLFYLFITSLVFPNFKFSLKTVFHFLPALVVFNYILIIHGVNQSMNFKTYRVFQNQGLVLSLVFYLLIIAYNIAAFYNFSLYKKQQMLSPDNATADWLKIALFGFALSCFVVQISDYFGQYLGLNIAFKHLAGNMVFLLFFCVLFYVAITSRSLFNKVETAEKYKRSLLTYEDALSKLRQIEDYMQINKPYTDPELNLKKLAVSMKISERYLSQIINEHRQQNFSDFINIYRIQYAMDLLKDPVHKEKTVYCVLLDAGFNSKTTFNMAFKKANGITPIEFKKKMLGLAPYS